MSRRTRPRDSASFRLLESIWSSKLNLPNCNNIRGEVRRFRTMVTVASRWRLYGCSCEMTPSTKTHRQDTFVDGETQLKTSHYNETYSEQRIFECFLPRSCTSIQYTAILNTSPSSESTQASNSGPNYLHSTIFQGGLLGIGLGDPYRLSVCQDLVADIAG